MSWRPAQLADRALGARRLAGCAAAARAAVGSCGRSAVRVERRRAAGGRAGRRCRPSHAREGAAPGATAADARAAAAARAPARSRGVVSATCHPSPTSPRRSVVGDADVGEEHLVEGRATAHLADRPDLDARARRAGRGTRSGRACFGTSESVRAISSPHVAKRAPEVHTFWPLTTHSSPSRTAAVGEAGQVGAGAGFAEQLAAELVGAQEAADEPLPSARRCRRRRIVGAISRIVTREGLVAGRGVERRLLLGERLLVSRAAARRRRTRRAR